MLGIMTGAVLNVVLDPLFIFCFGLGVQGAAIATIHSQFISFWILLFIAGRKGIPVILSYI
ncbi:MAG: polysaccharide biosynthesis C-terminal domain-containing protein, partial [Clostridium sp.]|nr:polysaccharide biosynthesis C-terminal domain-containing protein [Clostridium sp.]